MTGALLATSILFAAGVSVYAAQRWLSAHRPERKRTFWWAFSVGAAGSAIGLSALIAYMVT